MSFFDRFEIKFLNGKLVLLLISFSILIGLIISLFTITAVKKTSNYKFCGSCHSMEPMAKAYMDDIHGGNNLKGLSASCADCHLPHSGTIPYMITKTRLGIHDIFVETFYNTDNIDWEIIRKRRSLFTYDSGCKSCHTNLQNQGTNRKAFLAHKQYYIISKDSNKRLSCVTCHQNVGHKNLRYHLKNSKKNNNL